MDSGKEVGKLGPGGIPLLPPLILPGAEQAEFGTVCFVRYAVARQQTCEWWIGKNVEGSLLGVFKGTPQDRIACLWFYF